MRIKGGLGSQIHWYKEYASCASVHLSLVTISMEHIESIIDVVSPRFSHSTVFNFKYVRPCEES